MNHFRDCHREEQSDVAIQLIDCSRGLPQSPRLLRNDKRGEFICRSAATKQFSELDRLAMLSRCVKLSLRIVHARDDSDYQRLIFRQDGQAAPDDRCGGACSIQLKRMHRTFGPQSGFIL
jgi:hypothetical protein